MSFEILWMIIAGYFQSENHERVIFWVHQIRLKIHKAVIARGWQMIIRYMRSTSKAARRSHSNTIGAESISCNLTLETVWFFAVDWIGLSSIRFRSSHADCTLHRLYALQHANKFRFIRINVKFISRFQIWLQSGTKPSSVLMADVLVQLFKCDKKRY